MRLLPVVSMLIAGCAPQPGTGDSPVPEREQHGQVAHATNKPVSISEAIDRGVQFLVSTQNPDGSWGTGRVTRGFEVYSMVPGSHDAFRVATTALCVMALREFGETEAHDRGLEYLIEHGEARRDDGPLIYNIWAHMYATQALAEEAGTASPQLRERMKKAAEWHIDRLARYETHIGGWNYYDFGAQTKTPSMGPTSFGTSAGLVALHAAREANFEVPQPLIDRAVRRLQEMRLPDGAYLYSHDLMYYPRASFNRIRGSIGRTQSCNLALWLWNSPKVDEDAVHGDLANFFAEHQYIEMGRKRQYPHESWYATAPYYYYFGHYYAARLIEKLGNAAREEFGTELAEHIVPMQDSDGSWWDYAMWDYHKPYGTAYAVMTLLRCRG